MFRRFTHSFRSFSRQYVNEANVSTDVNVRKCNGALSQSGHGWRGGGTLASPSIIVRSSVLALRDLSLRGSNCCCYRAASRSVAAKICYTSIRWRGVVRTVYPIHGASSRRLPRPVQIEATDRVGTNPLPLSPRERGVPQSTFACVVKGRIHCQY